MQQAAPLKQAPKRRLEQLEFDNRYARLGGEFISSHPPEALQGQRLVHFNSAAGAVIDLDPQQAERDDLAELFACQKDWSGTEPVAMCYAGHQFGQYVPRLGDGRALLLGQVRNSNGELWDLQLKGSGQTLYSRMGDGKAVLRSHHSRVPRQRGDERFGYSHHPCFGHVYQQRARVS